MTPYFPFSLLIGLLLLAFMVDSHAIIPPSHRAGEHPAFSGPIYSSTFSNTERTSEFSKLSRAQSDVDESSHFVPAFNVSFTCSAGDSFCNKAQGAFKRAVTRISSELSIKLTINVDLSMFLPCGTQGAKPDCPEFNTLGFALPTQRFQVRHKDDNQIYLYPTSLLKQLDFPEVENNQLPWPQFDILARFNAQRNWWFAEDGGKMASDQRDLEQVALHELLHGLGYGDDTLMSFQVSAEDKLLAPYYDSTPPSIQPPPESTDAGNPVYNGAKLYQFTYPSIWNRFTYLQDRPVSTYTQTITAAFNSAVKLNQIPPINQSNTTTTKRSVHFIDSLRETNDVAYKPSDVYAILNQDTNARSAMSTLWSLGTKSNTLDFRPNVWPEGAPTLPTSKVILETALNPYLEGSSFAHVTQQANRTSDFLMVYRAVGITLDTAISTFNAPKSGIGGHTKDILIAMGYTPQGTENQARSFKNIANIVTDQITLLTNQPRLPRVTKYRVGVSNSDIKRHSVHYVHILFMGFFLIIKFNLFIF